MAELVVLVLNNPAQTGDVLDAWLAAGVSGVTILHSTGLTHHVGKRGVGDDLPLFPSLADLLQGREEPHRTLFAVVTDGLDVAALVNATEIITGPLDEPNTGIVFVVPVRRAWGLHRTSA